MTSTKIGYVDGYTKHKKTLSILQIGYYMYIIFIAAMAVVVVDIIKAFVKKDLFLWWEQSAVVYVTIFYAWVLMHLIRRKEKTASIYSNGRQFLYRITVDTIMFISITKIIRPLFWVVTSQNAKALSMSIYYLIISMVIFEYAMNVLANGENYYSNRKNFEPKYTSYYKPILALSMLLPVICHTLQLCIWKKFVEYATGGIAENLNGVLTLVLGVSLWSAFISAIVIVGYMLYKTKVYFNLNPSLYMTSWSMLIFVFFGLMLADAFVILTKSGVSETLYLFREIYMMMFILLVGVVYKVQVATYKRYGIAGEI